MVNFITAMQSVVTSQLLTLIHQTLVLRILLYMFFDNMSKQTGQPSMNSPKDLETIKELFSKEKQNGLQPAWGRNLIDFCK